MMEKIFLFQNLSVFNALILVKDAHKILAIANSDIIKIYKNLNYPVLNVRIHVKVVMAMARACV